MPQVAIEPKCSDSEGRKYDPTGVGADCYDLFKAKLAADVEEAMNLDTQNMHLFDAARSAAEDAMADGAWPAGYKLSTTVVVFSRQSDTGWDQTKAGAALSLHHGSTFVRYFSAETKTA